MEKVNRLLSDHDLIDYYRKNQECETDRIYCHHDLTHALDVARIAWILNLEESLGIAKDVVYAAALLHDIGRWMQYESGVDHDAAGKTLAKPLLERHGFGPSESAEILEAIGSHREGGGASPLESLLFKADKLSRNCVSCGAIKTCKNFSNGEAPFLRY